jgi:glutamine cyclotransferase
MPPAGVKLDVVPFLIRMMILISNFFSPVVQGVARRMIAILIACLSLSTLGCPGNPAPLPSKKIDSKQPTPTYGCEVVHTWPHDREAFTQGLVFHDGKLLESTGEVGHSSLRRVEMETGKVLQKVGVPPPYFAEGITLLKGKIYQLTWQHQLGFIYDAWTFEKIGQFNYQGEGWGLANDGESLILSDGSNHIRFLDPENFQVSKTINVVDGRTPVTELNELEYIHGEIYANLWHADRIARIDPQTGRVVGWINLAGLLSPGEVTDEEAVLNGIAYDESGDRLFVTGKLWPKLFEIRVKQK